MRSRSKLQHLGIRLALLAGLVASATSAGAAEPDCSFAKPWRDHEASRPSTFSTITALNEFTERSSALLSQAAKDFYPAYRKGLQAEGLVETCLPKPSAQQEFNRELPHLFLQASLDELAQLKDPAASAFVSEVVDRARSGKLTLFKLVGHVPQESNPTGNPGGYHRANRSVFMDIGIVPGNEWLVVLSHELAHAIDDELNASLDTYNDPDTLRAIGDWGHRFENASQLTDAERARLDAWIMAGLQRGLLTEIRAWTSTAIVYEAGIGSLWTRIAWMDTLLANRNVDESWRAYMTRTLSPRFTNPTEGLFALRLVAARLVEIRAQLVEQSKR